MNKTVTTPATQVLENAGVAYERFPYEHDAKSTHYGDEAAQKLGLDPSHVFKTLVIKTDSGSFGVVVVPVSGETDLKAAAAALGGKRAELASAADVQRLTGYVLGGVSPLGMRTTLPTILDVSAESLETMYVSGGRRGFDIGLAPQDLVQLARGTFACVGR